MRKELRNFIREHNLVEPKDKVLLAVSGGVDSMVMLHLFHSCGYDFAVAHCNFSLRGSESDADEELVQQISKTLGKNFYTKRFSTLSHAQEKGESIQVAARELRYKWFRELCEEHGFNSVAVAHNKNDIAETMLINLCRGTGLKGLTGIKPKSNGVIRPLLFAFRKQIEVYAQQNDVEYRTDSSNTDTKYARNRIRHNIIPEFEQINAGIIDNLYSTSLYLSQTWQAIDNMNSEARKSIISTHGNEVKYSIAELAKYPFRQAFLVEELAQHGFPPVMALDIEQSLYTQSGKVFFAPHYRLIRDRDFLILTPIKDRESEILVQIDEGTQRLDSPLDMQLKVHEVDGNFEVPKSKTIVAFDFHKINYPLILRTWCAGDWFVPFGMKGRKKLSDFLVDQKVPLHEKERVFVLESKGEVAWVVGFRTDNRFRVDEKTSKVLVIELQNTPIVPHD